MKYLLFALCLGLLLSCASNVTLPSVDELKEVDLAFSAMSAERGMKEAFLFYADKDVVMLRKNNFPLVGRACLEENFTEMDDTGFRFTWQPSDGMIAVSGDLGFTYGTYSISALANDSLLEEGSYVSIWKKNTEGQWRYVLDAGNEGLGEK